MADTESFEALLRQYESAKTGPAKRDPQVGDKVTGKVISIGHDHLFVDLGAKSEGAIRVEELKDAEGNLTAAVGDTIETIVIGRDTQSGALLLGSNTARRFHGGAELEQAYHSGLPVEGLISGVTKGGVEVQIGGARGFCPASQLDVRFVEDVGSFVGQRHAFRITRYEAGRHVNLVVSRRVILEEEQRERAAATRARLEVGAVLQGTVTSLQDYGAFVDLGGVEGMVHISELAFGRIAHPKDVLTVGQQVEVSVLRIEKTDNPSRPEKIALSIRALADDPWHDADRRFPVGAPVKGTVTRLQPYGAFVELAPGVEGLVHISELGAGRRINQPQEVVSVGDAVEATVLGVDLDKRRISLSLDSARQPVEAVQSILASQDEPGAQGQGTLGDLLQEALKRKK